MEFTRRRALAGLGGAVGVGGAAWVGARALREYNCDVACFAFDWEGFDDAPDWLTIAHVAGRDLPAGEVFIDEVVVESEPGTEWVTDTVAWADLQDDVAPSDGIGGRRIRVDIGSPDVVQVLWRHEGDQQVLDETRNPRGR